MKKISFCITCKNRFHQISQTLPLNLKDNAAFADILEFVLVDFDSKDGLAEWVLSTFKEELEANYLKFYSTTELPLWHGPIAKNTAHRLASGEFLVNLDCDNFTGRLGGKFVYDQVLTFGRTLLLHQFSGDMQDGTFGRIGMRHSYFMEIGGYDESFYPMGYEDADLINRLYISGLVYKRLGDRKYCKAIRNSTEDSVVNSGSDLTWEEMDMQNNLRSVLNISTGRIAANNGNIGIHKHILCYADGRLELLQRSTDL